MSEPSATAAPTPTTPAEALLQKVRVASPCPVSWDAMPGGDTVRSCAHCQHKVYNLSAMSAADASELLRRAEGKLCVRFYRRADGTVMTHDCPVGLRAVRVRIAKAVLLSFGWLLIACGLSMHNKPRSEYPFLLRLVLNRVSPEQPIAVMGAPRLVLPMAPIRHTNDTTNPIARPKSEMGEALLVPHATPAKPTFVSDSIDSQVIVEVVADGEPVTITNCQTNSNTIFVPEAGENNKSFLNGVEMPDPNAARPDPFVSAHKRIQKTAKRP